MSEYNEALKAVLNKEWLLVSGWLLILFAVVLLMWISSALYFRNQKKNNYKKYCNPKQIAKRRKSVIASAVLTLISVLAGFVLCADVLTIQPKINSDIRENSYDTYSGGFYIQTDSWNKSYDRWAIVKLDNGEYVYLYMNDLLESALTERGDKHGTIVYGEHSRIAVDIKEYEQ